MSIIKHIPNFITSLNLLGGCAGILYAFTDRLEYSVYCIWLAMAFDFLDGFAARILKVSSPIGKELDSLADMVTFGVLPSFILFQLIAPESGSLAYIAFLTAIFSALRLAKFNVSDDQGDEFIGVPTPANALFISSLIFVLKDYPSVGNLVPLLCISIVSSIWLVVPVKLLALKFKNTDLKENIFRYIFLLSAVALILIFKYISIPLIILLYLVLSIVKNIVQTNNIK